jgi:mevalonyl-CoA ligase
VCQWIFTTERFVIVGVVDIGYWNNEIKTKEVMVTDEEGQLWMMTGDEGLMDKDGYLTITGRIKDIIIRGIPRESGLRLGGENILPLEIENILFSHSGILQASVVAIADEKYGEVVGAFIERDPHVQHGPSVTRDEVKRYVAKKLARYKVPKYVFFLGEDGIEMRWPVTASGKIRKVELRAWGDEAVKSGRVKN